MSEFEKWRAEQIKRGKEASARIAAAGFKPCGHSALGCYNDSGACCADCDHGTYWRALHAPADVEIRRQSDV